MGPMTVVNAEYGNGGTPFGFWGLYGSGGIKSVQIIDGFTKADNTVIAHKAKKTPPVITVFPTGTDLTVEEF
jgi:hypothetical protein